MINSLLGRQGFPMGKNAPNDRFQDVTLGAYFSCGLRFDGTYTSDPLFVGAG